jgi:tetratricopeptide (TPR) repeat protein
MFLPHAIAVAVAALLVAFATAPAARAATPMQECWVTENNALDAPALQRAIAACSLMLKDSSMPNEARAGTYLHRGVARRRLGEIAEALGDLLAAKQYAPTDAGIARMLAWTYRELERPADSEAEYDRALELDPHWQGYLSRCVVRIDRKDFARGLEDCRTAAKSTDNEDIQYFSSLALARLTRLDEAVAALEPATAGPHASARLFELLAAIHETKGKRRRRARPHPRPHQIPRRPRVGRAEEI